ncbi:hypothetical protein [Methanoculleus chikugoensis]|uniref:Uncharacterized protein n=1 Tax=Methanoculleus chikugoensis TaxID=118126 RepID=A0ABM7H725_9EURY|nr:hypothetical protein [Methanoculleus chikugoensis]BBL68608.1 hypothetical protein MchiMG62_17890 [Methanoculleus chikugoensis]
MVMVVTKFLINTGGGRRWISPQRDDPGRGEVVAGRPFEKKGSPMEEKTMIPGLDKIRPAPPEAIISCGMRERRPKRRDVPTGWETAVPE